MNRKVFQSSVICLLWLVSGTLAVTLTGTATQTVAGQDFVFSFTGVEASDGSGGILTIRAKGDYTISNSSEYLNWSVDGITSGLAGPVHGATVLHEFDHHDVEWQQSFLISNSDMVAIASDGFISITLDLTSEVNFHIDPTDYVSVELNYGSGCLPPPVPSNPDPCDGAVEVPIDTNLSWGPPCDPNCGVLNGGFENGGFAPWMAVKGPGNELRPWEVSTAGGGWFGNGVPYEGSYYATNGFDGDAGLYYELYQEVEIPDCATTAVLSWAERIQWDLVGWGARIPRSYVVSIKPSGGGAPIAELYTMELMPGTWGDTGYVHHQIDLLSVAPGISGQTVRISFYEYIPERYTGPAQFDLDGVSLVCNGAIFPVPHTVVMAGITSSQTVVDFNAFANDYENLRSQPEETIDEIDADDKSPSVNNNIPEVFVSDEAGNLESAAILGQENSIQLQSIGSVINSFASPGTYPAGLTWKSETLYHVDKNAGKVYQLDPTNGAVLSSIGPLSGVSFLFGLTWDGTYFWGTDPLADTIFKFNTAGTIIQTFPAPSNVPVGITWDGHSLWVCDSGADRIYEVDPSSGSVRSSIPAPDTRVAGMGFDGTALWTNGRDSATTYRISRTDGSVLVSLPTPPRPGTNNGQGCTFDGRYLWVANWDVKMIYQIDIDFAPPVTCDIYFDVYFGEDPNALELIASDLTEPNCRPGNLNDCTMYSWQVVAKNPIGETPGPVWSFTTAGVCNQDPNCSEAVPSVSELWPPNHKWFGVSILNVNDPDGDDVNITITGITQDEPVAGRGSGNTAPDGAGVGTSMAYLRAERQGTGNGRVYEISFEAQDGNGGSCQSSVTVCVPHDRSAANRQCVDDGQIYDSTAAGLFRADLNDDGIINQVDLSILTYYWMLEYDLDN